MSKQCPHCDHYNTEKRMIGNLGYAAVQGCRVATAAAAGSVVGIFNKQAGKTVAYSLFRSTESWGDDIKRYHCCNCGRDF